jgi:hypothetical protein
VDEADPARLRIMGPITLSTRPRLP